MQISSALEQAKAQGAPQNIIDLYQSIKDELITANRANRGRTTPIPWTTSRSTAIRHGRRWERDRLRQASYRDHG
jgi:hypothetical protein